MKSLSRWLFVALLLAGLSSFTPPIAAADIPEEIERKIDEKTEGLPDEVREKIKEQIAKQIEAMKEKQKAAEESDGEAAESEEGDAKPEAQEEKKEDGKEEKKGAKPAKPSSSDEAKKIKSEIDLYETRFKQKVHEYKKSLEAQLLLLEKSKLDRKIETDRTAGAEETKKRLRAQLKHDVEVLKYEAELAKYRALLEKAMLGKELDKMLAEKKRIETQMSVETVKEQLEDRVLGDERYPDDPFQDGVLSISPRRIALNGPIMTGSADYVCERLDYFNNQSSKPIFIIIDSSPGGSVIEGFQILQGMKESKAPVHVVVKRFAASMAACITTLSDHSYCYPNAIILHHQASTMLYGNGREMEDQRKQFDEISKRLIGDVAEKVGTTQEEFVKQMYENRVSGDWDIFGDEAVERGWVGHIATGVIEESIRKRPTGMPARRLGIFFGSTEGGESPTDVSSNYLERYEVKLTEQIDEKGRPYVRLPRISPIDAWLLYNPDGYYRY